jgi:serine/threonine protein kinase
VTSKRAFAGRYDLIERLGLEDGRLGELYRARDTITKRQLALRVTHFASATEILDALKSVVALHSALIAARLPIVAVVAEGSDDENAWYAMEFAAGESILANMRRNGRMPPQKAVPLLQQLTACIAELHERNVLHRDLSTRNVFVDGDTIKVAELGVGAALARALEGNAVLLTSPRAEAPEQLVADAEPRTDLYAIGCIAHYLLAGRKAIAEGPSNLRIATRGGSLPPRFDNVEPELQPILARTLAMRPDERFASARELAQALANTRFAR